MTRERRQSREYPLYPTRDQCETLREAFDRHGLWNLSTAPFQEDRLVYKPEYNDIPVLPDGEFWYFCGGQVLHDFSCVAERSNAPGHYMLLNYSVVVSIKIDGHRARLSVGQTA